MKSFTDSKFLRRDFPYDEDLFFIRLNLIFFTYFYKRKFL